MSVVRNTLNRQHYEHFHDHSSFLHFIQMSRPFSDVTARLDLERKFYSEMVRLHHAMHQYYNQHLDHRLVLSAERCRKLIAFPVNRLDYARGYCYDS